MRRLHVVVATVALLARIASAASAGETLYRRYCASCHGVSGRGDGPAAESLAPRPTDLTKLDAGVAALMQSIDGRRAIRAHGSAAMPVWGHVLETAKEGQRHKGRATLYEVQAIAEYVRSLQREE